MLHIVKNKSLKGFGYMTANMLPGRIAAASGPPPLTIPNALAKAPVSIAICGNTADGRSVGEKSMNLLYTKAAAFRGISSSINATRTRIVINGTATGSGGRANPLSNTITLSPGKAYTFCVRYISGSVTLAGSGTSLSLSNANSLSFFATIYNQNRMARHESFVYTVDRDASAAAADIFAGLNVSVGDRFENYTLEVTCYEGVYSLATIPDTAPYGAYILPVEVSNDDSRAVYNIYTQDALSASQELYVYPSRQSVILHDDLTGTDTDLSYLQADISGMTLYKGVNIINTDTLVSPAGLSIQYLI